MKPLHKSTESDQLAAFLVLYTEMYINLHISRMIFEKDDIDKCNESINSKNVLGIAEFKKFSKTTILITATSNISRIISPNIVNNPNLSMHQLN